ncbi:transcription factor bHLH96-like isoform X2 [Andrographis paniculata]|uniref:transcription factor bHLH96-like isoform X2 n=1 Tax=Andrographis paniculata TaxID=175694 RepID=UPI0021E77142|nr:transcription factor bHLH96-like isoform X2 [Andrographis paniculata]
MGTSPAAAAEVNGSGRRRRKRTKNKEEAESQRMTHIALERNRRKLINHHLSRLRSLMPQSYLQRGDQASIVGGAVEFVKELEHILQYLEAKKHASPENPGDGGADGGTKAAPPMGRQFAQYFAYHQNQCGSSNSKYTWQGRAAEIEVTLIESHANIRILSRRRVRQLSKMVAAFQAALLSILHLNVISVDVDAVVLYSVSAKVR